MCVRKVNFLRIHACREREESRAKLRKDREEETRAFAENVIVGIDGLELE